MYNGERLDKGNFSDINSEHTIYTGNTYIGTKMTAHSCPV
jgi:hypothetical protein